MAIQLDEGTELIDTSQQGSSAARHAQATLEDSVRPAAKTELQTLTLTEESSRRVYEPATGIGGPDLF